MCVGAGALGGFAELAQIPRKYPGALVARGLEALAAAAREGVGSDLIDGLQHLLLPELDVLSALSQLTDHLVISFDDGHVLCPPLHVFLDLLDQARIVFVLELRCRLLLILSAVCAYVLLLPYVVRPHLEELFDGIDLIKVLVEILRAFLFLFLLDLFQHLLEVGIGVDHGHYLEQLLHDGNLPIAFLHWIQRHV